jgi:hypothetical protein
MITTEMLTLSLSPKNSGELIIARAGARYTKDGPCTSGSLVPNNVCSNVVIPETSNTVDTTAAVSSYNIRIEIAHIR